MGLNVIAMVAAKRILPFLGIALPILGAVLGVIQVALGLQIIQASLRLMWTP
jgi:small neutral amino acid transporter SnatA (MarC family)